MLQNNAQQLYPQVHNCMIAGCLKCAALESPYKYIWHVSCKTKEIQNNYKLLKFHRHDENTFKISCKLYVHHVLEAL